MTLDNIREKIEIIDGEINLRNSIKREKEKRNEFPTIYFYRRNTKEKIDMYICREISTSYSNR